MPEEEAVRLGRKIAAQTLTRYGPGKWKPGWSSEPFIPLSERVVAEGTAKKVMKKS